MRPDRRTLPFDELTVALAVDGHHPTMSSADRLEAVRRLNATGLDDGQIATQLRLSRRSVQRIRAAVDLPAVDKRSRPVEPTVSRPAPGESAELTPHRGAAHLMDTVERSSGGASFIDGFMSHPFNLLVAKTVPPCSDRWDIFSPPEPPDWESARNPAHRRAERARLKECRAICARCPIQAECLEYAMRPGERGGAPDEVGVWAGTTERERELMHRARTVRDASSCHNPQTMLESQR